MGAICLKRPRSSAVLLGSHLLVLRMAILRNMCISILLRKILANTCRNSFWDAFGDWILGLGQRTVFFSPSTVTLFCFRPMQIFYFS